MTAPFRTPLGTQDYFEDDRVSILAHFLADFAPLSNIEIEAKIGFYNTELTSRYRHIALLPSSDAKFTSGVPKIIFDTLKHTLFHKKIYEGHTHLELEDTLYDSPDRNVKFRKTRDLSTGEYHFIKKTRLKDLNFVVIPETGLGFRISANLEESMDTLPDNAPARNVRKKNRDSFGFLYMTYDLTKVEMGSKLTHEVEIEISNPGFVKSFAVLYNKNTDRQSLLGIAKKFWMNILDATKIEPRAIVARIKEDTQFMSLRSQAYLNRWGGTQPVIGDYLYEIASTQDDEPLIE